MSFRLHFDNLEYFLSSLVIEDIKFCNKFIKHSAVIFVAFSVVMLVLADGRQKICGSYV